MFCPAFRLAARCAWGGPWPASIAGLRRYSFQVSRFLPNKVLRLRLRLLGVPWPASIASRGRYPFQTSRFIAKRVLRLGVVMRHRTNQGLTILLLPKRRWPWRHCRQFPLMRMLRPMYRRLHRSHRRCVRKIPKLLRMLRPLHSRLHRNMSCVMWVLRSLP